MRQRMVAEGVRSLCAARLGDDGHLAKTHGTVPCESLGLIENILRKQSWCDMLEP